jgi:hypothetical protein
MLTAQVVAGACRSRSSSIWRETQAAIRRRLPGCTGKVGGTGQRHRTRASRSSYGSRQPRRVVRQELRGRTGISARGTSRCSRSADTTQRKIQGERSNKAYNTGNRPAQQLRPKRGVLTVTATSRSPRNTGKLNHAHPHDGCGWFGVFLYTQRVAMRREVTGHVVSRTMPLSAQSSSPS